MLLAVFSSPLSSHFPIHLTQTLPRLCVRVAQPGTRSFSSENWISSTFIGLSAFFSRLQACSKESQSVTKIKPNRSRCESGKSFPGNGHCSCMFRKVELAPADALQQIHVVHVDPSYILWITVLVKAVINMCSILNICSRINNSDRICFEKKKKKRKPEEATLVWSCMQWEARAEGDPWTGIEAVSISIGENGHYIHYGFPEST